MMLQQTTQAKDDAATITPYVWNTTLISTSYAHRIFVIELVSIPSDGWTPDRVGRALVDYADNGWSPFGGTAVLKSVANLTWQVVVYTD